MYYPTKNIIILLIVPTTAIEFFQKGKLFIEVLEYSPLKYDVGLRGSQLVANDMFTSVNLLDHGALWFPETEKYLTVTEAGKVVLGDEINPNLSAVRVSGNESIRSIKFKSSNIFSLCLDYSIQQRCSGSTLQEVELYFEIEQKT